MHCFEHYKINHHYLNCEDGRRWKNIVRDISQRSGKPITHVFFLDAYKTWWVDGKSYLCRIVDILNSGLVDEVIVGREVLDRWPKLLKSIIE